MYQGKTFYFSYRISNRINHNNTHVETFIFTRDARTKRVAVPWKNCHDMELLALREILIISIPTNKRSHVMYIRKKYNAGH